jgi:hypothetical protein
MRPTLIIETAQALNRDLKVFAVLCEDILALATREHQALAGHGEYRHFEFSQQRKTLLPDIESLLKKFKNHRATWQQVPLVERERFQDLKALFQSIHALLMRVLLLDRENQQAMLKRGLVPVKHLPGAAVHRPHYVADMYRKNSAV